MRGGKFTLGIQALKRIAKPDDIGQVSSPSSPPTRRALDQRRHCPGSTAARSSEPPPQVSTLFILNGANDVRLCHLFCSSGPRGAKPGEKPWALSKIAQVGLGVGRLCIRMMEIVGGRTFPPTT